MPHQMTEMLKGTLEGIVLAMLADGPAYGYEITTRLQEQGFTDLVEGTVYALLVRIEQRGFADVEKVPSEKGPPRKVFTLNDRGREQLAEFLVAWTFLSERIAAVTATTPTMTPATVAATATPPTDRSRSSEQPDQKEH